MSAVPVSHEGDALIGRECELTRWSVAQFDATLNAPCGLARPSPIGNRLAMSMTDIPNTLRRRSAQFASQMPDDTRAHVVDNRL
jgi:hypothetical protein